MHKESTKISFRSSRLIMLIIALNPILGGCNMLHKLYNTDASKPETSGIPSDYMTTGIIGALGQHIPIRCLNSDIGAYINDIQVNKYEFQCINEYLRFGDSQVIVISEHQLILTGKPVAPIGSIYKIKSILQQQSASKIY